VSLTLRPDRLVLFDETSGRAVAALSPARHWQLPAWKGSA
jgi:hypothetical protein